MTIIEKIKQSVEGATVMPFLYHAAGELNELLARCNSLPVAYSFLIDSGTIDDVNGRYHERVTIAVMFCDKTEFDFNAIENEEIIDRMKVKAYKWMQSLRMSNTLRIVSINSTQRLYDNTTDILTGFAVNITIEDVAGVGECELPDVVFEIKDNGEYPVVGIDKVIVSIPNSLTNLVAKENGKEYLPADYGVYGFGSVKTEIPKVKVSSIKISDACINEDGRWDGESLIDTSECTDLKRVANGCDNLIRLDVSDWDTSKVTTLQYSFTGCKKLEYFPCRNWDVGKCTDFFAMFQYGNQLKTIDVSNWDMSSATNIGSMFLQHGVLQLLDLTKWNAHNVTRITNMFGGCGSLRSVIGNRTIDDVLANDIRVLNGLKLSLDVKSTILDRASLRALINGLADLTGQTAQTLTLGAKLIAKLTEEDIAIATNKNWTIA